MPVEPLVESVLGDQSRACPRGPRFGQCQLGLDLQLRALRAGSPRAAPSEVSERLISEIGEGRSAPEVERMRVRVGGGLRIPSSQGLKSLLPDGARSVQVELLGGQPNGVSGGASLDRRTEPSTLRSSEICR